MGGQYSIMSRIAYYKDNTDKYNLIFLGDSRTYCGIHPEVIDPLIGTKSVNLSSFSNWMMTQYQLVKDVIDDIPPNTTVVLSVGYEVFVPIHVDINYPITIPTAIKYELMGLNPKGLWKNVFYFKPFSYGTLNFGTIHDKIIADLNLKPSYPASAAAIPEQPAPQAWVNQFERMKTKPNVLAATLDHFEGKPISITAYMQGGGYYRTELDHKFFRGNQKPVPTDENAAIPPLDERYLKIFADILDLFKEHKINLVINEIEQAPYIYDHSQKVRKKYQNVMDKQVASLVRQRGFPYIRTDLYKLTDSDYFDYNHMNSTGIEKYDPMLARKLAPHINKRNPDAL